MCTEGVLITQALCCQVQCHHTQSRSHCLTPCVSQTLPEHSQSQHSSHYGAEKYRFNWRMLLVQAFKTKGKLKTWKEQDTTNTNTRDRFMTLSWDYQVSRWKKKSSSGLYGATEYNRGKHTDNLAECHSIPTNHWPTSIIPPIFMLDALPDTTDPIYRGLGQAPNMLACIPSGVVNETLKNEVTIYHLISV